ncbi:MAG TPA: hypothetical protein VLF59_01580 [Candidatus Saccharimonadales bacterium]|nr:hypothetical protein [Candidatus Saccharimonadales bacterium]
MQRIKRLLQVGIVLGMSFAITGGGQVFAARTTQQSGSIKLIAGHFATAADPECTVPAEDCITDQLTGGFIGRNELTTQDFTETDTHILYHDTTVITVTGGQYAGKQFAGNEHGDINKTTGNFTSCAELTATDNSGDTLVTHNYGYIDLTNNHDTGHYIGVINGHHGCENF